MLGKPSLVTCKNLIYTTKGLAITAKLALFIGGLVVASSKLALDMSFSQTRTITTQNQIWTMTTQNFAPESGNLTLSVRVVSEKEVVVNVTFFGTTYVDQPGHGWVLFVSNSTIPVIEIFQKI
jgi:hypothetical protein